MPDRSHEQSITHKAEERPRSFRVRQALENGFKTKVSCLGRTTVFNKWNLTSLVAVHFGWIILLQQDGKQVHKVASSNKCSVKFFNPCYWFRIQKKREELFSTANSIRFIDTGLYCANLFLTISLIVSTSKIPASIELCWRHLLLVSQSSLWLLLCC